jgi:hypothetical protein
MVETLLCAVVKRSIQSLKFSEQIEYTELMQVILSPSYRYMSTTLKGPVLQASGHFGVNSDRYLKTALAHKFPKRFSHLFPFYADHSSKP